MNSHIHKLIQKAKETAEFDSPIYPIMGLSSEAGETLGVMAKLVRGDYAPYTINEFIKQSPLTDEQEQKRLEFVNRLSSEMFDVFWFFLMCLDTHQIDFDDMIGNGFEKLKSRKERNVIKGNGDNR